MEEDTLRQQLGIVDQSLGFLLILIASVLLSFYTVVIQRRGLCLTILGDTKAAAGLPDVYPIKRRASAMVVGSLGFFLCLALNAWQQAEQGDDCVARRSATVNLWASLFAPGGYPAADGPGFRGVLLRRQRGGGAGGETAGGQYTTGLDHPFQEATL